MAFPSAAGYGNLPFGNFSPVIFSKKAQIAFRKTAVIPAITSSEYFGDIANFGDSVNIIKEPDVLVKPYKRGQKTDSQELDDNQITLVVDQSNYFQFQLDDIEKKHAHINWEAMAADRAAYNLRDKFDTEIMNYMYTQMVIDAAAVQFYGTEAAPTKVGYAATQVTPLNAIVRVMRLLDDQDVPNENRYIVVDPYFAELLQNDNSKILSWDYMEKGIMANGELPVRLRGFKVYMSRNLPVWGTGPTAVAGTNGGAIFAGHTAAVATAEQLNKTERFRSQDTFADVVRGMHLYGRKLLRPNAMSILRYNSAP